ncbi:MAG: cytidine deaminase [Bacteroidota bacterium]
MRKERISFELEILDGVHELSDVYRNLLELAHTTRDHAYAPYSNFQVGAALLMENGEMIIGSNQENASFPAGLCAERVAVFQAGARFPGKTIEAMAISAAPKHGDISRAVAPCGNCRQALLEYEIRQQRPITLILAGGGGQIFKCASVKDILPLAFDRSFL